jgi:hypothetical protein
MDEYVEAFRALKDQGDSSTEGSTSGSTDPDS